MRRTLIALSLALVVVMFAGTAMAQSYHHGPRHQPVLVQAYVPGVGMVMVTPGWYGPPQNFGPLHHNFGHRRHYGPQHNFGPHHGRRHW